MSSKKNIDQLFKERFNSHEVQPPAQVWENIQATLREEKKDRKVLPLWWKLAGVAALIVVMFTIGSSVFSTSQEGDFVKEILDAEKLDTEVSPDIKTEEEFNSNNNAHHIVKKDTEHPQNKSSTSKDDEILTDSFSRNKDALTTANTKVLYSENVNKKSAAQTAVVIQNAFIKNKTTSETVAKNEASTIKDINATDTTESQIKNNNGIITQPAKGLTPSLEGIAQAAQKEQKNASSDIIPQALDSKTSEVSIVETDQPENEKESIFDAIKEQNEIEAKEVIAVNEEPTDRWEVAPNFAPVYYNTLSEGSSIDGNFADNSQSGDVNISFGVAVSYAVSNRLSIRSGIYNVNLGYSTGGLELGEGDTSLALRNVDYNTSGKVTIPQDIGTFSSESDDGSFGNITPKSTGAEAFINQNITYYEVPLELKYSLFDTKFGINIIGGLSTLFLGDNEITVNSGDFSETLGEANNLSNLSFSTNVGLGFDYKFSEKFKFNVEPMFKYQLNPYTNNTVDFQPYYVGVYTGLSYKF